MSNPAASPNLLLLLMRASSATAERINAAVVAAGYAGLRPAHGLVFVRIAGNGANVSEIAAHLGITKQSAGTIVDQLLAEGYVVKEPDPRDRRAQLVRLTTRGEEVTSLASEAVAAEWRRLEDTVGGEGLAALTGVLEALGRGGVPRPVW